MSTSTVITSDIVSELFNRWRDIVAGRRYDEWFLQQQEEQEELDFACENDMEPVYWCRNCKYGCCDDH